MNTDCQISPIFDKNTVTILFSKDNSTLLFTAIEIKNRLTKEKYHITLMDVEAFQSADAAYRIVLTTREELGTIDSLSPNEFALPASNEFTLPASKPEGYSIRKKADRNHITWYIIGFDKNGTMYGGLDFVDEVLTLGFSSIDEIDKEPYISSRGIKLNVPLDARTPSYSDSGDSAQENIENMWDIHFWCEFLDEMAKCKLNTLSLWNLNPFPSMVKVPSYPNAALQDVMKTTSLLSPDLMGREMSTPDSLASLQTIKKMTIEEKIDFWRDVMIYAQERGVDIYLFTWNTFVYGTENSGYNFTTSVTDVHTQDYFRKSVDALIQTYPLLKGIGITAGENMSRDAEKDELWLYNSYGKGIQDALSCDENRKFRLIHRIQFANIALALKTFYNLHDRCIVETSFKYSQAHVYSSVKPGYIHEHDDAYLRDIGEHKTWLTLRDDDYYMCRGGSDPSFIREFISNMPYEKMQGYYLGSDGYTWGREYIGKNPDSRNELVVKKRWYSLFLWGSLTYDPGVKNERFISILHNRFPDIPDDFLFTAWAKASQVIPLVNRFHNEKCQMDFEWYPEGCTSLFGFHDINSFIRLAPQPGEGIIGITSYVNNIRDGIETTDITPEEVAGGLWEIARECLSLLQGIDAEHDNELHEIVEDIKAMAYLGQYYSKKILGALYKCMSDYESNPEKKGLSKTQAVQYLEEASEHWKSYAAAISHLYKPQTLTRMVAKDKGMIPSVRYMDVLALQKDVERDIEIVKSL